MSQQLRLLPAPKPLSERFGAAFFRGIPGAPGVYRMFDDAGLLLYVGQSRDLRDRLNSYRHVHPDRDSRKIRATGASRAAHRVGGVRHGPRERTVDAACELGSNRVEPEVLVDFFATDRLASTGGSQQGLSVHFEYGNR